MASERPERSPHAARGGILRRRVPTNGTRKADAHAAAKGSGAAHTAVAMGMGR